VDTSVSSTVVTISGLSDWALEAFEQSPQGGAHLDRVIMADLVDAYDATLASIRQ